jgi:hypothetical protein
MSFYLLVENLFIVCDDFSVKHITHLFSLIKSAKLSEIKLEILQVFINKRIICKENQITSTGLFGKLQKLNDKINFFNTPSVENLCRFLY